MAAGRAGGGGCNDELAIDFAGGGRRRPVGSAGGGSGGGGTSDELALECVANG